MVTAVGSILCAALCLAPQEEAAAPTEADFYEIVTIDIPDDVVLEASAITVMPDGRPMVATRRGEVYLLEDAYHPQGRASFRMIAEGLQEPLGLLLHDGWVYVGQRGELSRMRDSDGDDRIDEIETVCDVWRVSGNYHEYLFGPRLGPEGYLWLTTNKPFGGEPFGKAHWRGFALRITPEGEMLPTCCGLRSPAGIETSPWGDVFYTDNQGEWCGASKLSHLEPGDFHGHPHGLFSCELPQWPYEVPRDIPQRKLMPRVHEDVPSFKLPAVWFPYDKMGKSPAGMVWDTSGGAFGPFEGQLFVSDQHHASVMRVCLESVDGHWQGAVFGFRYGFQCGIIRLAWGKDHSLFAGMTNRGWGGRGNSPYGLQRLVWTGAVPFEIHTMSARADGFVLTFTDTADAESAADPESYRLASYTYELHPDYGSNEMDRKEPTIVSAEVSEDSRSVRLRVDGLRAGYVHELHASGVRAASGEALLHDAAYYTLIEIPHGE
ncbi:MAG: hypothetical protein QF903_06240 [Planctomycetota bacterium]|nr:hypothetical protein [Planctomycetota bacterium]MDP6989060.1 hypothetical protein [Planctomycetota bacterium]